jgi:hypothetical protein
LRAIGREKKTSSTLKIRRSFTTLFVMNECELMPSDPPLTDLQRADRDAVLRALGLDPQTIVWDVPTSRPAASLRQEISPLTDDEWREISATQLLPTDVGQAAMSNRVFVGAVLSIVSGRSWTDLDAAGVSSEAVRKKFARLALKGVWQSLASRADDLSLSPARRAALKAAGSRARQIERRG